MKNISLAILWVLIVSRNPFIFNVIEGYPHWFITIFLLVAMILILLAKMKLIIGDKNIFTILAIQLIYFLFLYIYYTDNWYLANIPMLLSIAVIYIFINSVIGIDKTIWSVSAAMAIIGILGIIGFFLAITGMREPSILYYRSNYEAVYTYIVTFTNIMFRIGGGQLIRVAGFFNESNVLGFYIIHALILNKLAYNNKKFEILLIFSGLFAFSLAFYILMLLYLLFFYINGKSVIYLIAISLVILGAVVITNSYKKDNFIADYVYRLVFKRFELSEEGNILKGNNRVLDVGSAVEPFLEKPFFGHGIEYLRKEVPGSNSTFMGPLVVYGVVGSFIFFAHVIYLCIIAVIRGLQSKDAVLIKAVSILLLSYLYRTFVMTLFSYIAIILLSEVFRRYASDTCEHSMGKILLYKC